MTNKLT